MDPIKLQQIINKKPKDVVTADEWNEILTLLIEQANLFSDRLQGFQTTLKQLIDGKLENVDITANVNSFGGRPPEDYTLDEELTKAINTLTNYIDTALKNKVNKQELAVDRLIVSGVDGTFSTLDMNPRYLLGINSNIQYQINSKLERTGIANNSYRINGKKITVSKSAPSEPSTGDVWISW